jgi:hypothetical protein
MECISITNSRKHDHQSSITTRVECYSRGAACCALARIRSRKINRHEKNTALRVAFEYICLTNYQNFATFKLEKNCLPAPTCAGFLFSGSPFLKPSRTLTRSGLLGGSVFSTFFLCVLCAPALRALFTAQQNRNSRLRSSNGQLVSRALRRRALQTL